MKDKIFSYYRNTTLETKIRFSYVVTVVPMLIMIMICFYNIWATNSKYDEMVRSAVTASEFSLDFKKDFDDETYLVIVENKTMEESQMDELLEEANKVVNELEELTPSVENQERLDSARKYLENLETYKGRIAENLAEGDKYEDNLLIWENDIQIVSNLLQQTMSEYIYYEMREFESAREEYSVFYTDVITAMLVAIAIITVGVVVLSYYIPQSISRPIKHISEVTKQVAAGDLSARSDVVPGGEVGDLSESLNTMIDKINELFAQVTDEQIRLRKAELELLQAQINPHFLYNTLDTIVWLAEGSDQKMVVSMVKSLSDFFRASLNQGREIVSVKEELVHVRSYLQIQQVRYQDIMTYAIDVPAELFDYSIPKITLQPLVENALYHGIKNKRDGGSIYIGGHLDGNDCVIEVRDTGIGMSTERLEKINRKIHKKTEKTDEIFGLSNVNERIALKFGENYGITVNSEFGVGTTIEVRLPHIDVIDDETQDVAN